MTQQETSARRARRRPPTQAAFVARARELRAALEALEGPYHEAREAFGGHVWGGWCFRGPDGFLSGAELLALADERDGLRP